MIGQNPLKLPVFSPCSNVLLIVLACLQLGFALLAFVGGGTYQPSGGTCQPSGGMCQPSGGTL